jgi:hypothetical protein
MVRIVGRRLRKIAACLQAQDHPENLRDRSVEPAGNIADSQPLGGAGEQLNDVQALFKSWGGVLAFGDQTPLCLLTIHAAPYYPSNAA